MTEVKIQGLEQLRENLQKLGDEAQGKAMRTAVRKAALVIRDAARANAARFDRDLTPESIEKNIAVQFSSRRFKATGELMFRVGVLGGAKQYANTKDNVRKGRAGKSYKTLGDKSNPGGDTFYWRFLEFGTSRTAAKPFLRDAADSSTAEVLATFEREAMRTIDRAVRRLAKKG